MSNDVSTPTAAVGGEVYPPSTDRPTHPAGCKVAGCHAGASEAKSERPPTPPRDPEPPDKLTPPRDPEPPDKLTHRRRRCDQRQGGRRGYQVTTAILLKRRCKNRK